MNIKNHSFTPREIVCELDRFIVGQSAAKKAVAIALRNRWRRKKIDNPLREEISPKNIILMGPTGCGKTEIARRLARLADAPFVKVEATKFTEVGYVGRDVDSMVRDLVEKSVKICKDQALKTVKIKAKERAEEKILDILFPFKTKSTSVMPFDISKNDVSNNEKKQLKNKSREKIRKMLKDGKFNEKEVNIDISTSQSPAIFQMFGQNGMDDLATNLQDALSNALGSGKKKQYKMKIPEALETLAADEAQKLIANDQIHRDAIIKAEQSGIIFIDEIDKVAGREGGVGPDISREGVQRDILPIVEGSTVTSKYGSVKTDHILFIAAGAFHMVKPSDLIPELQGRFPIRVELDSLTESDFVQILTEPENSLVKQYIALLNTEKITLNFTKDGIHELAKVAATVNSTQENIGARRLYTVMERLLEEESFFAPERKDSKVTITAEFVNRRLSPILKNEDLSKFIL